MAGAVLQVHTNQLGDGPGLQVHLTIMILHASISMIDSPCLSAYLYNAVHQCDVMKALSGSRARLRSSLKLAYGFLDPHPSAR